MNNLIYTAQQAVVSLRKSLGMTYISPFVITDKAIRDRFVKCLTEVLVRHTQGRVAKAIGCHPPYLAALKSSDTPKIPALMIAKFCSIYNYSPHYILLGKGEKRSEPPAEEKKDLYYLRIIEQLLAALLEFKGSWNDATGELIAEAMRKKQ